MKQYLSWHLVLQAANWLAAGGELAYVPPKYQALAVAVNGVVSVLLHMYAHSQPAPQK